MHKLKYGQNEKTTNQEGKIVDKKESSFIIVFLRKYKPWEGNSKFPQSVQDTETPVLLLLERWDGRQGFIGGFVDNVDGKKEELKTAAIREAKEETNWVPQPEKVKPLISHSFAITTHAHSYEASTIQEMQFIEMGVRSSEHYMNEIVGTSLVYINDLGRKKGLTQILQKNMATSCLEELIHLIVKENLVPIDTVKQSCIEAGLNFDELIS